MGKIDRLSKEHPEFNVNLLDLIRKLDPSTTGKFMPFLIKQVTAAIKGIGNGKKDNDSNTENIINTLYPEANYVERFMMLLLVFNTLDADKLFALWEFETHMNENRIEQKDITKYQSWNDIINAVFIAELKSKEKILRKQIDVIYDKDGWLVIKPLSFESSLAYGAGTKWCTAMKNNPSYFYQYSERGMLIYVINKMTGYKVAMFVELNEKLNGKKLDISFWDTVDIKTESMELDIPAEILSELKKQINDKTKLKSNKVFFSKTELNELRNHLPTKAEAINEELIEEAEEEIAEDEELIEGIEINENIREAINILPDGIPDEAEADIELAEVIEQLDEYGGETQEDVGGRPEPEMIPRQGEFRMPHEPVVPINYQIQQDNHYIEIPVDAIINRVVERERAQDIDYLVRDHVKKHTDVKFGIQTINQLRLAPGIPELDVDLNWKPAPWLKQIEINIVNQHLLKNQVIVKNRTSIVTFYAYPNGKVIKVVDHINKNIIVHRHIEEIRSGRNENEPLNPFGVEKIPILSIDTYEDNTRMNAPPIGLAQAYGNAEPHAADQAAN